MTRFALLGAIVLAGCSRKPPAETPPPALAVIGPDIAATASSPSVVKSSPDLGDKALAVAVAPDTPALMPAERFGIAPQPRISVRIANPDASLRVKQTLPPIPSQPLTSVNPGKTVERVPLDLGNGLHPVFPKPTLPVAAGINERARDVNIPPPLPAVERQIHARVSLDDPTADLRNKAIVKAAVKRSLAPAAFLKMVLPNPLEFSELLKPRITPDAEPGQTPVSLNPPRVK